MSGILNDNAAGLEQQAKVIRKLLKARKRARPVVIEFSGSPKSGKTTAISVLSLVLRRNGLRVEAFAERASVSPLTRKGDANFNLWVSCGSLQGLIESVEKDLDVFILDRGIFDGLVWNAYLAQNTKISSAEATATAAFFSMDRWTELIDLVCVIKCDPKVSIHREYADDLTPQRGRILNETTLSELNLAIDQTVEEYRNHFKRVITFDTSGLSAMEGTSSIVRSVIPEMRRTLDESLCVLHRSQWSVPILPSGFVDDPKLAERFVYTIQSAGEFIPQSRAEEDPNYLIPIPCAVLVHADKVLLLERNESGHALDKTFAIWAGGHVLERDGQRRNIIEECLKRELREELLIGSPYSLKLLGLVTTDQTERASRHIGIVFLARLSSENVVVPNSRAEFEASGADSQSGLLIRTDQLSRYFPKMGDWAKAIVRNLWPEQEATPITSEMKDLG